MQTVTRTDRATRIFCRCHERYIDVPDRTRIDELDALYRAAGWTDDGHEYICGHCAAASFFGPRHNEIVAARGGGVTGGSRLEAAA